MTPVATTRWLLYAGKPLLTEAAYSPRSQATPVACGGATPLGG
ncbi:hypothetical protein U2718_023490 [Chlorogloeopsis sp. ULAP02]